MPVTQSQCAERVRAPSASPFAQAPGRLTVTPPSWRFDLQIEEDLIEEVIRVIGYSTLPDTPPMAPVTARSCTESRRSAHDAAARDGALADYQETINFSFVEERWERELAGNSEPDPRAEPDREPACRDALEPHRAASSTCCATTWRARRRACACSSSVACSCATHSVQDGDSTVAGLQQPMRLAGLAYRQRRADAVGHQGAAGRLLRREGRHRSAAGAAHVPASSRASIRRCIRVAARASSSTVG